MIITCSFLTSPCLNPTEQAFEEAILNVTHQGLGDAILPPLLAALRTRVSQSLREGTKGSGGGNSLDRSLEWGPSLRVWRAASAVLLDGGGSNVGFFERGRGAAGSGRKGHMDRFGAYT